MHLHACAHLVCTYHHPHAVPTPARGRARGRARTHTQGLELTRRTCARAPRAAPNGHLDGGLAAVERAREEGQGGEVADLEVSGPVAMEDHFVIPPDDHFGVAPARPAAPSAHPAALSVQVLTLHDRNEAEQEKVCGDEWAGRGMQGAGQGAGGVLGLENGAGIGHGAGCGVHEDGGGGERCEEGEAVDGQGEECRKAKQVEGGVEKGADMFERLKTAKLRRERAREEREERERSRERVEGGLPEEVERLLVSSAFP